MGNKVMSREEFRQSISVGLPKDQRQANDDWEEQVWRVMKDGGMVVMPGSGRVIVKDAAKGTWTE